MSRWLQNTDIHPEKGSGGEVVKADRWFPSSKTCSACGLIKEDLTLADRELECECGFKADRDVNAAINLRNAAVSSTVSACRLGSAGRESIPVKLPTGQEPNVTEAVGLGG